MHKLQAPLDKTVVNEDKCNLKPMDFGERVLIVLG